jgi:hypothetical protein
MSGHPTGRMRGSGPRHAGSNPAPTAPDRHPPVRLAAAHGCGPALVPREARVRTGWRLHASVAQRKRHRVEGAGGVGSNPAGRTDPRRPARRRRDCSPRRSRPTGRAPASYAGLRGFESSGRHFHRPTSCRPQRASQAQADEQPPSKRPGPGSNPGRRTDLAPLVDVGEDAGLSIRRSRVRFPHGVLLRGHGRQRGPAMVLAGRGAVGEQGEPPGLHPGACGFESRLRCRSGVEQLGVLVGLISPRSSVRIRPPLLNPTSSNQAGCVVVAHVMPVRGRPSEPPGTPPGRRPRGRHGVRGVPERTPGRDPGREGSTPSDHPASAWSSVRPSGCKPPAPAVQVGLLPDAPRGGAMRRSRVLRCGARRPSELSLKTERRYFQSSLPRRSVENLP